MKLIAFFWLQVEGSDDYEQYHAPLGPTVDMIHSPDGIFDATIVLQAKPRIFTLRCAWRELDSRGGITYVKLVGRS